MTNTISLTDCPEYLLPIVPPDQQYWATLLTETSLYIEKLPYREQLAIWMEVLSPNGMTSHGTHLYRARQNLREIMTNGRMTNAKASRGCGQ